MSIKNIIAGSISAAGKYFLFLMAFAGVISMTSCSESDDTEDEFENWQDRNDKYFNDIYSQAETAIKSGDGSWKIIRVYSKDSLAAKAKSDFIVVHVETEGTGTKSPILTDSVRVHYRGRLIPSTSYADGYQFDSSWTGDYNLKTMIPTKFKVGPTYINGNMVGVVTGFATALMNMHTGDRWTVYIPYALGYGVTTSSRSSGSVIPGYSTLRFDLTLVDFVHVGEKFPLFQ